MRKSLWIILAVMVVAIGAAPKAHADNCGVSGNLVANCGFETGDATGWTISNSEGTSTSVVNTHPLSGSFSMQFANDSPDFGEVSQTIADKNGQSYTFNFLLLTTGFRDVQDQDFLDFQAFWDGTVLFNSNSSTTGGPFTVIGTGSDTISFIGFSDDGPFFLDNVSVAAVPAPEPGSLALIPLGLAALLLMRKRAGHIRPSAI